MNLPFLRDVEWQLGSLRGTGPVLFNWSLKRATTTVER
jgi:hypothetical protein